MRGVAGAQVEGQHERTDGENSQQQEHAGSGDALAEAVPAVLVFRVSGHGGVFLVLYAVVCCLELLVLQNVLLELLVTLTFCLAVLFKLRLVLADERHLVLSFQVVELLAHADLLVTFGLDGGDANFLFGGGFVETAVLAQLLSQRGFLGDGACRAG